MPARDWISRDPLPLLIKFSVVAGALFLFRTDLSRVYLATMVPLVNGLFRWDGVAVEFVRQQHVLQLVYRDLGLQFTVHDIIYQNVMVAVALFAATPGTLRWKARWIALVLAALWVTHVASLYLGGYVIIWDYIEGLPGGQASSMAARVTEVFPRDRDWLFSRLFGIWHTWGRPTLAILIWLFAARDYLRLPAADASDALMQPPEVQV